MSAGSDTLSFAYDTAGAPYSVKYNGTTYYYITDLQGDVTAIVNGSGVSVAEYTYNAWGKLLTATGTMSATLGALNPLRYRGYVYDAETGFYYLQSRYYDPGICRFINADEYASTGQGFVGCNMFAYCLNNPVNCSDPAGDLSWEDVTEGISGAWESVKAWGERTFGLATICAQDYSVVSFDTLFFGGEAGPSATANYSGNFDKPVTLFSQSESQPWRVWEQQIGLQFNFNRFGAKVSVGSFETTMGIRIGDSSAEVVCGINKIGFTTRETVNWNNATCGVYHHAYIRTIPTALACLAACYIAGMAFIPALA